MENKIEVGIQEKKKKKRDTVTKVTEIATADVVDGNTVKLKDLNFLNYCKIK